MSLSTVQSIQPRTYVSLEFPVVRGTEDEAAGILIAHGALGCEVVKLKRPSPNNKPQNSDLLLRAYFEQITPAKFDQLTRRLTAAAMLANGSPPNRRSIVDPGWATMWQRRFCPLKIGERLLIVPPWHRDTDTGRLRIVIRPGQAFGTGHHPSTALTLSAIERLCSQQQIIDALDVGTGSGILSIAMVKLGVPKVVAIDIDAAALANARDNARLNRVAGRIRLSTTALDHLSGRFGLIAANILGSVLIGMAANLKRRLRRGGYLVLAGILRREVDTVASVYRHDLSYVDVHYRKAWATLIFQK
jgi:ribosomal protein L11 methyltransferase